MQLLQPLLLWQSVSLFWFCGLLLPQYPAFSLAFSCFLLYIDARLRTLPVLLTAGCVLLMAFVVAGHALPKRPVQPAWTLHHEQPVSLRLEGVVHRVQSLPDGRLRVFLQNVHAVESAQKEFLPGLTVWTWDQRALYKQKLSESVYSPLPRPVAGQRVRITAKVRDTVSFRNEGNSDFGFYWQSQGVFWRIWSRGWYGKPEILGEASYFASKRALVRENFDKALHLFAKQRSFEQWQAIAFLPAVLMGERFYLAQSTVDAMQGASLVHSLALSGQHLAFAALLAWFLVRLVPYVWARAFLYIPRVKLMAILALPLACLYLWLGNAPASLVRAACMLAVAGLLVWRTQVVTLSYVLVGTLVCITVYDPLSVYNIGLQLSALCVASICLVLPILRTKEASRVLREEGQSTYAFYIQVIWKRSVRLFKQIFCISLAIQVCMLPLFLWYFPPSGMWFMANVFWLPLLSLWVIPLAALGLVLANLGAVAWAAMAVHMAAWPCEGLIYVLHWMQEQQLLHVAAVVRPYWTTALAWIAVCVGLAYAAGRVGWQDAMLGFTMGQGVSTKNCLVPQLTKKLCIIGACLLCVGPIMRYAKYTEDTVRLDVLDVGQGQSVLISLPGGQRVLVDGGGSFSSRFDPGVAIIVPRLTYNERPRLWAMVSSHPDVDHLRGLLHILPKVHVEHFFDNGQSFASAEKALWESYVRTESSFVRQTLYGGREIKLPDRTSDGQHLYLEILSPQQHTTFTGNNASLVLRLVRGVGEKRVGLALLCGDAEAAALQALLDSGQDIRAEVLVLSHHGAKDALLPAFYAKVAPKVALASAGRQNSYEHPHDLVRDALQQQGIPLYSTSRQGSLQFIWSYDTQKLLKHLMGAKGYLPF